MGYTSVGQRNGEGAGIQPKSVNGYVPVSSREQPEAVAPVVSSSQPVQNSGYIPVDKRPAGYTPTVQPKQEPVAQAEKKTVKLLRTDAPAFPNAPTKNFFNATGEKVVNAIGNAVDRPENKISEPQNPTALESYKTLSQEDKVKALKEFEQKSKEYARKTNTIHQLPSQIVEHLPLGIGAVFKAIHDEESAVVNNEIPYEESGIGNVTGKDAIKSVPGATIDTVAGIAKGVISGALNFTGKTKVNIPGLGEITSAQYRTAERVANGENPVVVALEEGSTAILDTLFFASLASKPFTARPVTVNEAKLPAEFASRRLDRFRTEPAKSFRLYEPAKTSQVLSPRFIETAKAQGVDFGKNFNPKLPTFFEMSFEPSSQMFVGKIKQLKPSWVNVIAEKFKGDFTKAPEQAFSTLSTPKEVKVTDIENAVKNLPKKQIAPVEPVAPVAPVTPVEKSAILLGNDAPAKTAEIAPKITENVQSTEIQPKTPEMAVLPQETPANQPVQTESVPQTTKENSADIRSQYEAIENQIDQNPENRSELIAKSNSLRDSLNEFRKANSETAISIPSTSKAGTPVAEIKVVEYSDGKWGVSASANISSGGFGSPFGTETFDTKQEAISSGKESISKFIDGFGELSGKDKVTARRIQMTLKKQNATKTPTQKEKVAKAVKTSAKSIKEIAEETKIKEPNIRRILGVGAKEGTFERKEKGVYVLSKNGQDLAYIETGSATESLPRLADEGFKADMVFFDIPYDTPAVKGGNRGVNYNLLSVSDFSKILDATAKIVKSENSPIIHMFSQAPSGMKAMQKYNDLFTQKGWIPVGRGEYQKTFADGKPVTSPNGKVAQPEGIIVFTKSGKLDKNLSDLNFTLKRPKGYQTEKPAEMLKAMIEMTTEEGDTVLDPFAGSGVTGAEAVRAGRKAYLIEKDANVAEKITKPRVKTALDEKPQVVNKVDNKKTEEVFKDVVIDNNKPLEKKKVTGTGKIVGIPVFTYISNGRTIVADEKTTLMVGSSNYKTPKRAIEDVAKELLNRAGDENQLKEQFAIGHKRFADAKSKKTDYKPAKLEAKKETTQTEKKPRAYKKGAENADVGVFADGTPVELGSVDKIRPIEFPELVDLARELTGNAPFIKKMRAEKRGFFKPNGNGEIALNPEIFNDVEQAAKTLAHEIGHLIDYLPDQTLARGNLLGRLKTLRGFMAETFGTEKTLFGDSEGKLSETRKQQIKNKATKDALFARGLKFGDMFGGKLSAEEKSALNKDISDRTREAVNELLAREGFIKNKDVQAELKKVTEYWRPYDVQNSSDSYKRYRNSSKEMYADALSMLLNSPGTLEKFAPTFYKEFFNALDKKPQVFNAYFELQEILGGDRDALLERRRAGVRGMFDNGDIKAADIQKARIAEAEARRKDFAFRFKFDLIDKNYALIDRVNKLKRDGQIVPDDENPVYFLEERNYLGGKIKAFMDKNVQPIYKNLLDNDISWNDFGEALFYERIASGDRSDVANPRGITPKAAEELLAKMESTLPDGSFEILKQSMTDFRKALQEVAEEAFQEGLYKSEMHDKMLENPKYVTFQVLDHLEEGVTSKIHKSVGTLKDVANPADASLLKTIATIRAIERNKVTKSVVEFLTNRFPEDILPAKTIKTPKGQIPQESKLPNQELITYLKDGKRIGYYVDPYIKHAVENESVGGNNVIIAALRIMNSSLFRPLFITYNPGFQAFNFLRDFQRFWKNTPDMTIARAIKLYRDAMPIAKARAYGITDPKEWGAEMLNRMEKEQILSITYNQLTDGSDVEDKQIDAILKASGIESYKPEVRYKSLQPFVKFLDGIKNVGDFIETLPKAAGYLNATEGGKTDITKGQKSFLRKNIGSPDFLAGGYWKPATNEVFLFSNAITQGLRSDISVAIDPKTRSGYWWKTAQANFIPKILMIAASLGLFGATVKEMMDGVSEYDKTNYTVIPLGTDANGKTVYFRMPADEGGRLLGAMLWKIMSAPTNEQSFTKDIVDVATLAGGQLPSVSPTITNLVATGQFLAGQNPYDWFRNREVLTDDQMKAGGMYAAKPFAGWLFNQSGGGLFYYFTQGTPKDKSGTEKALGLPLVGNVVGRFIKVSDYGKTEKLNQIKENVQSEQARKRIDENTVINRYIKDAQNLKSESSIDEFVAKNMKNVIADVFDTPPSTEEDLNRIKNIEKKLKIGIQRGQSNPYINALISASTNEEKGQLIAEYKKDLPKSEFNRVILDSLKYKIISQQAILNASKVEK